MFFNNTLVYMTVQDSILNKYVLSRHDYSKGAPVRSCFFLIQKYGICRCLQKWIKNKDNLGLCFGCYE